MSYHSYQIPWETQSQTRFPILREVLREDLTHYADDDLVVAADQIVPVIDLDELEFRLSDIGRAIGPAMSQVGQVLGRAAPGAISGAFTRSGPARVSQRLRTAQACWAWRRRILRR